MVVHSRNSRKLKAYSRFKQQQETFDAPLDDGWECFKLLQTRVEKSFSPENIRRLTSRL